ncbi:SDR family oxidoreductase [Aquamicrobium defluvii]|uniref:NADP-dependent 3-hydroxy acid dehydrogenase YdfG n=1 Tax=Aquamicrobium defluvii TaxID=69279 RepID=A0A011TE95_9HYPH|nr:SDR family oxidoreductase [Aquamicrobium defluvii]EXL02222.1 short-chain dehydrogenase [Aquamicrobium defluvii]EZQ12976.1 short-chain dehydrogenase [Halopseudomonas bauzanensis]
MTISSYTTALVTGASSGIGEAVARTLAERGLNIIAVGRDAESLARLQAETGAVPIVCDITDRAALAAKLNGFEIDVLVNNAGVLSASVPFHDLPADSIDAMIDVNLRAAVHLTQYCLPGMMARNRGHIVFIGSSAGLTPHPTATVYGATKAAISSFAQALRLDLLGRAIRISEVAPGRVETRLYRDALGLEEAQRRLYDDYSVLQPQDLATLIETVLDMPQHVDVSRMEIFPTTQAVGGGQIVKNL